MTIRVGYDECKTWNETQVLHAGPAAYPDLCVLPDMTIGCLCERGDKDRYEKITFIRFNLGWLSDGKYAIHNK